MSRTLILALSAGLLAGTACERHDEAGPGAGKGDSVAIAQVRPTAGNEAHGTVAFEKVNGGVRVVARLEGLAPGKHGFHIHESGDCSAPDASSAGEHFNPTGASHGGRLDERTHVGDMGNIEADASGKSHLEYIDPRLTLDGGQSVVGKAIIVHAGADDLRSQPSGDSGARVACGVIERDV